MRSWLPANSPSPPTLDAETEQAYLRRLCRPLAAVDGATELAIADDGVVAASVDSAGILAVEATLHDSAWRQYDATPGSVGFDPEPFVEVLDAERDRTGLATLTTDEQALTLELPSFRHTSHVDISPTVTLPDVGDWPASATTYHEAGSLKRAFEYFSGTVDTVAVGYDTTDDDFYIESVTQDVDEVTRYRRQQADLLGETVAEPARSVFGTEHVMDVVSVIPDDTVVRLDIAEDFPMRLTWDLTGSNRIEGGTPNELRTLIAPRASTDEDAS